jgi:hypothetical protein
MTLTPHSLDILFKPKAIVAVGASTNPFKKAEGAVDVYELIVPRHW